MPVKRAPFVNAVCEKRFELVLRGPETSATYSFIIESLQIPDKTKINMDKIKLTREEALRRWKASKEIKRKMSEKLEHLVRDSCKKQNETNKKKV